MKIILVSENSVTSFELQVNRYLKDGYEFKGKLKVREVGGQFRYIQLLIKKDK